MGKGEERHGEQVDKHCIFNDSAEPAGLVCFATLFFFFFLDWNHNIDLLDDM